MTRITVDATLLSKLLDLKVPLELCDESGRVLAKVRPAVDLSQYEPLEPRVGEEELRRRAQANVQDYTTAEVLAYLEKL